MPEHGLVGHVSRHRRVERPEVADTLAVLGVLAHADVDAVVEDHRRGDDVVLGTAGTQGVHAALGVGVELPEQLAALGLEGIDPAVAAAEHDLGPALHDPVGRVRPVAVDDVLAGKVALPDELARVLVEGDEARGPRRWDVHVALVHAVRGGRVEEITYDQRRAGRQVVGEHVQLPHHVELPDHVSVARILVLLGGDAFVLARLQAVGAEADDLGLVRGVVEPLAFHERRGADALLRPIVDAARGQLVGEHLP